MRGGGCEEGEVNVRYSKKRAVLFRCMIYGAVFGFFIYRSYPKFFNVCSSHSSPANPRKVSLKPNRAKFEKF